MTATKQLEASRAMTKFFAAHRASDDPAAVLAFGVRLLALMNEGTPDKKRGFTNDFLHMVSDERQRAESFFRAELHGDLADLMWQNFRKELMARASGLEHNKQARAANYLRCLRHICDAYMARGTKPIVEYDVSKAAIKAIYAGADPDKIKTAAAAPSFVY